MFFVRIAIGTIPQKIVFHVLTFRNFFLIPCLLLHLVLLPLSSHSLVSKNKIAAERPQKGIRPCKNHQSNVFGLFCEAEPMIPVFFVSRYLCFHLSKVIFHTRTDSNHTFDDQIVQIFTSSIKVNELP